MRFLPNAAAKGRKKKGRKNEGGGRREKKNERTGRRSFISDLISPCGSPERKSCIMHESRSFAVKVLSGPLVRRALHPEQNKSAMGSKERKRVTVITKVVGARRSKFAAVAKGTDGFARRANWLVREILLDSVRVSVAD